MLEIGTTSITQGTTEYIPNAVTRSSWPKTNYYQTQLTSASIGAFVQGYVYGADTGYYSPLDNILVWASGVTGRTTSTGFYLLNTTSGAVTVTANHNADNTSYSPDSQSAALEIGDVATIPTFHLPTSGVIWGFVGTGAGSGALPNVVVKAARSGATYESFTDNSGYFYIRVTTSAFTYTVSPVLAAGQAYTTSPSPLTASITTMGQSLNVGNITVTGGMGRIAGQVKDDAVTDDIDKNITTGVLILASQGAISDPPPAISGATSPGLANAIFTGSSQSDGTYFLEVTAGSYYMSAYYPKIDPYTGAYQLKLKTKTPAQVTVTAGQTTPNIDFTGAWP
jgi:hypothetical protein